MKTGFLSALLGLAVLSAPAFGNVVIDFGQGLASGGTVTLNTTTGVVTGSGIGVGEVSIFGAPNPNQDGEYIVTGGMLNYSFTGNPATGATTLSITGTIGNCFSGACSADAASLNGVSGTLLSGTSPDEFSYTGGAAGGPIDVSINGADVKNATLLADLGLTGTNFDIVGGISDANSYVSHVGNIITWDATSTDLGNDATPEPTSILLLGTIVSGAFLIRRRMVRA